jgi:ABC-type antimicrobial peptide transport system permease subunit
MFKNYFKTAWRNFKKNKLTTAINVFGLSIGISAALIIYLIIQYSFSFDTYEGDKDRIYRVVTEGENSKNSGVPAPLAAALKNSVNGIETAVPIFQYFDWNARVNVLQENKHSAQSLKSQESIVFTDGNYFSMFPHEWIAGNATGFSKDPYKLILSESRAQLYFPGEAANELIGKTVIFSDSIRTTIAGIIKDLNVNSDFEYKAFISLPTITSGNLGKNYDWDKWTTTNSTSQLMIKLLPAVKATDIDKQITSVFNNYITDKNDLKNTHRLQPLSDIHTNTGFGGKVDRSAINGLVLIVLFLLLLACVNFINLSTAQGIQRAKEVAIRKTFGSNRRQIIFQFLTETFLLALLTTVLCSFLVSVSLKSFIPGDIPPGKILNLSSLFIFVAALIFLVTILAGAYPAFFLSKFQPVRILKSQVFANSGTERTLWVRKGLIIFQFVIAQIFVIGVIVVKKQINFSVQKDMGFRKDAVINFAFPTDSASRKKYVFADQISKIAGVQAVSIASQSPAFSGQASNKVFFTKGNQQIDYNIDIRCGDTSYLHVYNIPLIAGRNVMNADTATELLINKTMASQLGFQNPADALGHLLILNNVPLPIVGVIADFNQASVKTSIHPLVFYADKHSANVMQVALQQSPENWLKTIANIESAWKRIYPGEEFNYTFLDATISRLYGQEQMLAMLLSFAAFVTVLISCMGLFGLIIFIVNSRTKEIGVRKILGASMLRLLQLLSADFIKLIVIAFLIAGPVAWQLSSSWLQNYAFHTGLSWWIFFLNGVIMIAITLSILLIKAIKVAIANPVKSLRTE